MKHLICGQWLLDLPEGQRVESGEELSLPYSHYLLTHRKVLGQHAYCFLWLFSELVAVDSVIEYFGGMGICTTIIDQVVRPESHTVVELDVGCVAHLQRVYPKKNVLQADAFQLMGDLTADLVSLDFNSFSVSKHRVHPEWLGSVFSAGPRYVEVTDSARSRWHFNRQVYGRAFGRELLNIEDYYRAWSREFSDYGLVKVAHDQGRMSFMLFERGADPEAGFQILKVDAKGGLAPETESEIRR